MIIFASRLFYLQVIKGEVYLERSKNNTISKQRIISPRGLIYDKNGYELAVNRPSINVYLTIEKTKNLEKTLSNLSSIVKVEFKSLIKKIKNKNRYKPILLLRDINQKTLAKVQENKFSLRGVTTDHVLVRKYPFGRSYPHLIGYLREIDTQDITKANKNKKKLTNYKKGNLIGKEGLEKTHERFLRGGVGIERREVDAHGRIKRIISPFQQKPGNNLHLTIDLKLQRKVSELFSAYEGSIIALNPNSGAILSMISHPNYDPNIFSGKLSKKNWNSIISNDSNPLMNRALMGTYPPGSIFKSIMAFAFLSHLDFEEKNEFYCKGKIYIGKPIKTFECWKEHGHGKMGLKDAIAQSCDVYFYKAGKIMGVDHIAKYASQFGLGQKTGLSKIENPGLLPTKVWKKKVKRERWYLGDTLNMSIGQGFHKMTPIQAASFTSAIANGGKIYQPYIVEKITNSSGKQIFKQKPVIRKRIHDENRFLEKVRTFLKETVNGPKGTGKKAKSNSFIISGKTGTAQVAKLAITGRKRNPEELAKKRRDHSWFIAFAPFKKPKIALVILAENSGLQGSYFGSMAKEIIEFYMKEKRGIRN